MESFILIAIAILAGYTLQKFHIFPKETPLILNQYIIYIALPAVILLYVPKLPLSQESLIPAFIAWIVMAISVVLVLLVSKIFDYSKELTGCLLLVCILTNSSIMGIPLINAYLGEESLPYVLIYDQIGSFIALATYGTFITAYYSSNKNIGFKVIVIKIITFPSFLALIVALFFVGKTFPPTATYVLNSFAGTLVPVALVAVGLQLQFRLDKEDLGPLSSALVIKLILAPFIAWGACMLFDWYNLAGKVAIYEAGMAPMITAGAMASMAGLRGKLSSAIVGYGILFSFITTYILSLLLV
jgi:predicted permease